MRRVSALLVAVIGVLVGCSAPDGAGPADGGTFVVGLGSEPGTLNPVLGYSPDGGSLLFDGLVSRAADLSLRPALAREVPKAEGTSVTFRLREGVTFHDGTPLTSEDVAYTYNAVLAEDNNSTIRGDYAAIEKVEAPDPATVVFRLRHPYAPILQRATLGIVPRRMLEGRSLDTAAFNTRPVGTGPYRFVSWTPGDKIVLEANEDYWGGAASIKRLVLAFAPDDNARATRMAAGEFDATELPPKAAARFDGQPGLTVHRVPSADYRGVMFPMRRPVTGDAAIRRALSAAVDRAAMVETILAGAGSAAFGPIAPGTKWHNPAVVGSAAPDRAQAARILEEAGWRAGPDGIRIKDGRPARFTLMYPAGDSLRKELALAVASDAKHVGIDVRLAGLDWDAIEPRMGDDALIMGWGSPYDPDYVNYELFHSSLAGQGFFNPGRLDDPRVDELLERGRGSADESVRKEAYDAFQRRVRDQEVWLYLVYLKHVYVVRGNWTGIEPSVEAHEHATGGLFRTIAQWKRAA